MRRNTTIRDRHRRIIRQGEPPCHICGEPIDYEAAYPDPTCFVVDHVVPIAKGGDDALSNKRAAHRIRSCNAKKSDAPTARMIVKRSGSVKI